MCKDQYHCNIVAAAAAVAEAVMIILAVYWNQLMKSSREKHYWWLWFLDHIDATTLVVVITTALLPLPDHWYQPYGTSPMGVFSNLISKKLASLAINIEIVCQILPDLETAQFEQKKGVFDYLVNIFWNRSEI